MIYTIFDVETDGLLDNVSTIHCLSYEKYENSKLLDKATIVKEEDIKTFIESQEMLVGHNIIRYDIPVLEKLLDVNVQSKLIDTLAISYYHNPVSKFKHGLEAWGDKLGVAKPKIDDWKNLSIEDYTNRCETDVQINSKLFHQQIAYTYSIYGSLEEAVRVFDYLTFKMECLKDQETIGIPLNIELAEQSRDKLEKVIEEKIHNIATNMPKVLLKKAPKSIYKKDGELSIAGYKWIKLLEERGLPEDTTEIYDLGNPGSDLQLKTWLIDLGWQPKTFKVSKSTGKNLPQISLPFGQGLCSSVEELFEQYPYLEELKGLYEARHRLGIFKSYLSSVKDGKLYATAHGFTNTLRLLHSKPIVNLPGVFKSYGKEIRGCLTVPDDTYIMCGSDVSSLEDSTKQHYIYNYDPDYVNEMRIPGFDPHLDIAVTAEMMSNEESDFFKWCDNQDSLSKEDKQSFKDLKKIRTSAKVVNFSAVYGAGPPKIASTLKCSLKFAEKLHKTYWERNKAVKQTANDCEIRIVSKQKWLYNPISKLWLFLKAEKDRFSTLNQSSGVYVFDMWLMKVRNKLKELDILVCMQYHDR